MLTIPTMGNTPTRAHISDAGADLTAARDVVIPSGEWRLIHTGIKMNIPLGWEGQIRPRSGLAAKHGVTVLNSPGTVDAGYTGEVMVNLINHGRKPFRIIMGERIAQLVISPVNLAEFIPVTVFEFTERGDAGHGSTGA